MHRAGIPRVFGIRKIRRVCIDIFLMEVILRHGRNTVGVFEDSLTEAIIVHSIHVLEGVAAVDLLQKLARSSRVMTVL